MCEVNLFIFSIMLAVDLKLVLLFLAFTAALGIAYIMSIDNIKPFFFLYNPAPRLPIFGVI